MKRFVTALLCVWLSSLPVSGQETRFTISTSYNNLLSNPAGTGMLDRIMYEVFDRLGIPCEIVYTPTEQSLYDVNAGVLDAELNRIEGMELRYPNLVRVPESNMVMEFVAFSKKGFTINGWESIRNLDIGIVRGWKILEENTSSFPYVSCVPTEVELFNMLERGRIDIALYARLTGYAVLQSMNLPGIHALDPPLARRPMYLYLHSSRGYLTGDIARTLREMKLDGTYESIVQEATQPFVSVGQ